MITEIMEAAYYCSKDKRLAAPLLDKPFTHGQGALLPPGNEALRDYVNGFIGQERRTGNQSFFLIDSIKTMPLIRKE